MASGKNSNPQTFNRFVYVLNNPILFTDPSGLISIWVHDQNAPEGVNRPTWISQEEFDNGGYKEWNKLNYTTKDGDNISLNPMGPFSVGQERYFGWSLNGLTQGTDAFKNFSAPPAGYLLDLYTTKASLDLYYKAENQEDFLTRASLQLSAFLVDLASNGQVRTIKTPEGKELPLMASTVPIGRVPKLPKSDLANKILAKINLYPNVIDQRTGRNVPLPDVDTIVDKSLRVEWNGQKRYEFIKEWYDRGFSTPKGGWDKYDIHHIVPREFGGTNVFENLVPVERETHKLFNSFWRQFGGM